MNALIRAARLLLGKPLFQHDCSRCTFLGSVKKIEMGVRRELVEEWFDLYHCAQLGYPTVSARFGNRGPEYVSGLTFGMRDVQDGIDSAMATAYLRARDRGLDVREIGG